MEWYNNPILRTVLQSSFKRSNQRIASLAKKYGKHSAIYKNEVDKFSAPNYKRFMSTSKSGNLKFDVRSFNKYILSGKSDRSVVNQLLSQAAGIRIEKNGEVSQVKGSGIKTVGQIKKRAESRAMRAGMDPYEMTDEELTDFENKMLDFSSNFQAAYDRFIAEYGEKEAKSNDVISQMYDRTGRLTYRQMIDISREFNSYKDDMKRKIGEFEDENGGDL